MKYYSLFLYFGLIAIFLNGNGFESKGFAAEPIFMAGAGRRDITPQEPVPMWGYGDRHAQLSNGTLDPLYASVVVIQAGDRKHQTTTSTRGPVPHGYAF